MVEETIDVNGSLAAPSAGLSPGTHYWRLFARTGVVTSTLASPTWQFTVGRRSAPVDSSSGTTPDFNGDGYSELVVGKYSGGACVSNIYVWAGNPLGVVGAPSVTIRDTGTFSGGYGTTVRSAGDVNGDGFADLLVGGYSRFDIFLGRASGLRASPDSTHAAGGVSQGQISAAGDINSDGFGDVVAYSEDRALVYLGGPRGLEAVASQIVRRPDAVGRFFGNSATGAGDVNGDGFADLILGYYNTVGAVSRAHLYLGGAAGLPALPNVTFVGPDGVDQRFGSSIAAGDLNGDGYDDVIVGGRADATGLALGHVYYGGRAGPGTTPNVILAGPGFANSNRPMTLGSMGDLNGDGFTDVVVGVRASVQVYLGGVGGPPTTPSLIIASPDGPVSYFGVWVGNLGRLQWRRIL
ncbi:MAG: VCBS repeat-containing protein [Deltaproteobacteria bacterium]|nr:VCBS repeat-containing protein [Deltaproteobacteria bacterium]